MSEIIEGSYVKVRWRKKTGKHIYQVIKIVDTDHVKLSNNKIYKKHQLVLIYIISDDDKNDILKNDVIMKPVINHPKIIKISEGVTLSFK